MIAAAFVVAALTLCRPARATPGHGPCGPHAAHGSAAAELYSLRAKRRIATYLRVRLLEWREEGLERAADVIEHRLPVDALVPAKHWRPEREGRTGDPAPRASR